MSQEYRESASGGTFPVEAPDVDEVEQALKSELDSALARLRMARTQLEIAHAGTTPDSLLAIADEHRQALAAVQRASMRFADFVLNFVVPDDWRK